MISHLDTGHIMNLKSRMQPLPVSITVAAGFAEWASKTDFRQKQPYHLSNWNGNLYSIDNMSASGFVFAIKIPPLALLNVMDRLEKPFYKLSSITKFYDLMICHRIFIFTQCPPSIDRVRESKNIIPPIILQFQVKAIGLIVQCSKLHFLWWGQKIVMQIARD